MPVTNYDTVDGQIISEHTDGVQLDYELDPLGTVLHVWDQTSTYYVGTYRAKPFGDTLYQDGPDIRFKWVGSLGYRSTGLAHAEYYARARHYGTQEGSWTTVDPLWPHEAAYGYVKGNPTSWSDPSGLGWPSDTCDLRGSRCVANSKGQRYCKAECARAGKEYLSSNCVKVSFGIIIKFIYCNLDCECKEPPYDKVPPPIRKCKARPDCQKAYWDCAAHCIPGGVAVGPGLPTPTQKACLAGCDNRYKDCVSSGEF